MADFPPDLDGPTPPPAGRYTALQMRFHWTMAIFILVTLGLGLWASFMTPGVPLRRAILEIHKSLGMTVFVLALLRIPYRLVVGAPRDCVPDNTFSNLAAHATHILLYGLMLFMPLSGYMFSSAGGYSLPWFGLFQWPRLLAKDAALAHLGEALHDWGAWPLYAFVTLHIAAAFWHQLVLKDGVLARMLPARSQVR